MANTSLPETPLANTWITTAEYTCHPTQRSSHGTFTALGWSARRRTCARGCRVYPCLALSCCNRTMFSYAGPTRPHLQLLLIAHDGGYTPSRNAPSEHLDNYSRVHLSPDPEEQPRDIYSLRMERSARDMRKRMSSIPYSRIFVPRPGSIFVSWSNLAASAAYADRA